MDFWITLTDNENLFSLRKSTKFSVTHLIEHSRTERSQEGRSGWSNGSSMRTEGGSGGVRTRELEKDREVLRTLERGGWMSDSRYRVE